MKVFHDLRQTEEWGDYLHNIGWQIVELPIFNSQFSNYLYIKKLPLFPFWIAKLQRPLGKISFDALERACRESRVVVLYYEPNKVIQDSRFKIYEYERKLREQGFRKTKNSYLPRKTIWLDLAKSKKLLLSEMKPKTRYNIGLSKRNRVEVKVVGGKKLLRSPLLYQSFLALLHENSRRLKIFGMPEKWFAAQVKAFGERCFVTLAYPSTRSINSGRASSGQAHELLAGNFFMESRNACFHSHNGSTALGRKLMAPTACVWKGVLEARRRKLKRFDFDGIGDGSKQLKKWKGFSRFKKGFGGREIEFVGQFHKFVFPL